MLSSPMMINYARNLCSDLKPELDKKNIEIIENKCHKKIKRKYIKKTGIKIYQKKSIFDLNLDIKFDNKRKKSNQFNANFNESCKLHDEKTMAKCEDCKINVESSPFDNTHNIYSKMSHNIDYCPKKNINVKISGKRSYSKFIRKTGRKSEEELKIVIKKGEKEGEFLGKFSLKRVSE